MKSRRKADGGAAGGGASDEGWGTDDNPHITKSKHRYEQRCREEAASGESNVSVAEDAMLVVFEWGAGVGLDRAWRLAARQPLAPADERASALATALEIRDAAYGLMSEPWRVRPVDDEEIERAADAALWTLSVQHPHLERDSLRKAIRNANYLHWHDGSPAARGEPQAGASEPRHER